MRVEQERATGRALDVTAHVIGELDGTDADRAGTCVPLREIAESMARCAGISTVFQPRLEDALRTCSSDAPPDEWRLQVLDDLRLVRDALNAVGQARAPTKAADDPFFGYCLDVGSGLGGVQYVDSYDLPENALSPPSRHEGSVGTSESPAHAGAMSDFLWEEAGPPYEVGFARPEQAKRDAPRMDRGPGATSPVQLGTSAPAGCRPGDEFAARFVARTPVEAAEVDALLRNLRPCAESHLGLPHCRWKPGTSVRVRLDGKGVVIDRKAQHFIWQGERAGSPTRRIHIPRQHNRRTYGDQSTLHRYQ